MCGIAGIWEKGGEAADPAQLDPMLSAMTHRGPDDAGTWHDGPVALGHRRLTILDLSERAHQPMVTPDGKGVLTYNGEVYNYRELRQELERDGIVFRSTGDTEVVLHALHAWGPERAIPRFDGMFALAYHDRRCGQLWLGRDRAGIKPLAVYDNGQALIFASEVKGILAHPKVERRIDRRTVAMWALGRHGLGSRSLFEGIGGLRAGEWWRVTQAGIERKRYFAPLSAVDPERIVAGAQRRPDFLAHELAGQLERSVEMHLASDVPIAAMCSGGVDSSLITSIASRKRPGIHAYVADLPWERGEAAQAERVGRHLGVEVRRVRVEREDFLRLWPETVRLGEAPDFHMSDPALLMVTRQCHADGIKVLLTGEGADELFGGYPWYATTHRHARWTDWPWSLLLPRGTVRRRRQRLSRAPLSNQVGRQSPSFRTRMALAMNTEQELLPSLLFERLAAVPSRADRAVITHCLSDFQGYLSWILLRHDRMGMAASIEMRVPFIENDIIDFAFHLPRRARLENGRGKCVVKDVAAAHLPRDVIDATKKGFAMPAAYTVGTEALLVDGMLFDVLEVDSHSGVHLLPLIARDPYLRFHAVGLELWLQLYFGNGTVEALGERLMSVAA